MDYYYDVDLNFLDNYYQFYEWLDDDNILNINKIPIILISTRKFQSVINNKIKVNIDFLKLIKNKTEIKTGYIKYSIILSDNINSIAIIFNELGESIFYSSLSVIDELNINEISYTIKRNDFNFEIIDKLTQTKNLRQNKIILNYIKNEIDNLYKNRNYNKLTYLYNELITDEEKDYKKQYINILNILNYEMNQKVYDLYNIIKLSYKNV